MLLASIVTAISQVLLKISANKKYKNILFEYLNIYVVSAYALFFLTTMLNVIAYMKISYKYGPIIGSSSYVFIMIFSRVILKEKITLKKFIGNIFIIIGIIVFSI